MMLISNMVLMYVVQLGLLMPEMAQKQLLHLLLKFITMISVNSDVG